LGFEQKEEARAAGESVAEDMGEGWTCHLSFTQLWGWCVRKGIFTVTQGSSGTFHCLTSYSDTPNHSLRAVLSSYTAFGDTPLEAYREQANAIYKAMEYSLNEHVAMFNEVREARGETKLELIDDRVDVVTGGEPPDEATKVQICISSGQHLKSCDKDGYCNNCGYQTDDEETAAGGPITDKQYAAMEIIEQMGPLINYVDAIADPVNVNELDVDELHKQFDEREEEAYVEGWMVNDTDTFSLLCIEAIDNKSPIWGKMTVQPKRKFTGSRRHLAATGWVYDKAAHNSHDPDNIHLLAVKLVESHNRKQYHDLLMSMDCDENMAPLNPQQAQKLASLLNRKIRLAPRVLTSIVVNEITCCIEELLAHQKEVPPNFIRPADYVYEPPEKLVFWPDSTNHNAHVNLLSLLESISENGINWRFNYKENFIDLQ
jgi:hypothetical protein